MKPNQSNQQRKKTKSILWLALLLGLLMPFGIYFALQNGLLLLAALCFILLTFGFAITGFKG